MKAVSVQSSNNLDGFFIMWLSHYRKAFSFSKFVKIFRAKMSSSSSSSSVSPPCAFFHAYRGLNLFLMFIGVSPFLQCQRTNLFVCHRKYIRIICIVTIIYLAFVIYLNSSEVTKLFRTEPNLYIILKSCHFFATSYLIFLLMIPILRERQSHANYFNNLYQFDDLYDRFIEPSIKYKHINRIFWTEVLGYGVYVLGRAYIQYVTKVYLFDSDSIIFRINAYFEQFIYGTILFYMKHCAHNLIVRFRKVNSLLYKFLTNIQQQQYDDAIMNENYQLEKMEKIAFMLNILIKAHKNLRIAFGSAFVLLFTFNLFGVAFNSYQIFDDDDAEDDNDDHPYYVGAIFFVLTVPPVCIFFNAMLSYHVLGNSVRALNVLIYV